MSWHLDYTDDTEHGRRWQFDLDCTLDYATFASSMKWDEEGTLIYPNDNTSDRMDWLNEIGITEDKFNELRQQKCGTNLVSCADPNTVFVNYGNYSTVVETCKSRGCRCVCKNSYQADSSGKCASKIETQSDSTEPVVSPAQIIGGVGLCVVLMTLFAIVSSKGGESSE